MSKINFPMTGWRLTPGYKPVEVTVVGNVFCGDGYLYRIDSGSTIRADNFHATRKEAILAGHFALNSLQFKLDKQLSTIAKRRAALVKAGDTK